MSLKQDSNGLSSNNSKARLDDQATPT